MRWSLWIWLIVSMTKVSCLSLNSVEPKFILSDDELEATSNFIHPESILTFNDRPPIPDDMPKCPIGTFLACCYAAAFGNGLLGCSWWDDISICKHKSTILVCCSELLNEVDFYGLCKDRTSPLQPNAASQNINLGDIIKLIPEIVPEVIPHLIPHLGNPLYRE